jgi:hypothetical protein
MTQTALHRREYAEEERRLTKDRQRTREWPRNRRARERPANASRIPARSQEPRFGDVSAPWHIDETEAVVADGAVNGWSATPTTPERLP